MSHGGGSDNSAEPNLTPLLDLVLQLVMFFMMVANFTMEQTKEGIQLPQAQSAQAMDKTDMEDLLYLNIDENGKVFVTDREKPLVTPDAISYYLNEKAKEFQQKAKDKGKDTSSLAALVIIRGHKAANFKDIYTVMQQCKKAGFRKWQVRAQTVAART